MKFGHPEQTRLAEYIHHRLAQLEEERQIIESFQAEHNLDPYSHIYALNHVLQELETQNDAATKEHNVFYLSPPMFLLDLRAILNDEKLPLPDALLEIQPYLDELERRRRETEERLQTERLIQESKRVLEIRRRREAEEKERKKVELCEQLGISLKTLTRLQEER